MKQMLNAVHIEGRLYDFNLNIKTTGESSKAPGTEFIRGTIDVATDDACLNVVQISFSYVPEMTKKGSANKTYTALSTIMEIGSTVLKNGKDAATLIKWDGNIDVNDFPVTRNGEEEWLCAKCNAAINGGFLHLNEALNSDETKRATWDVDMVITNFIETEADEERNLPVKGTIKGYVFNFFKTALPVEFVTHNAKAIDYFTNQEIGPRNPLFTHVWGREVSQTIVTKHVEESAFGDDMVTERTTSKKEYLIVGTAKVPYEWDSENTITAAEMKEALASREISLADTKQRRAEYTAAKATNTNKSNDDYLF